MAAAPPVTATSVPVPVAIWILPPALRVTLAAGMPAAVAIAFKISDTFAALPEASPIVVLPLAVVVTVVTVGSKVIVWAPLAPVMVSVVPVGALASALRMVPLRWGVADESSDVVVDAIANALSCNATEPVPVVEV
ncbi:hypothetical protein ACVWZ6_006868 [Bradyrhizobium sp. GM6.1]